MFRVSKEYRNANIARTIRFTSEIYEKLTEVAQENEISFNLLVLQCCKYALDDEEIHWKANNE